MADNLPIELLSEITCHLSDRPASLDGLQVGFTCQELYREFQPVILNFYREKLLKQYGGGGIKILAQGRDPIEEQMDLEEFELNLDLVLGTTEPTTPDPTPGSSTAPKPFDFEFWLMYCPATYDVDGFWSLINLLSRTSVIRNMSILVFGILPPLTSPDAEMRVKQPTARWARALMKLFEVHTKREDAKLNVYWDALATTPTSPWANISPSDLSVPDWTNSLANVGLSGPIDLPVWNLFIVPIFRMTSSTSTELHISDFHNAPRHAWVTLLNSLWDLPHLRTFEVASSVIPIHSELETDKKLDASPTQGNGSSTNPNVDPTDWLRIPPNLERHQFLPNLYTIGATINLLLLLAEANICFPRLAELVLQETQRHATVHFGDLTLAIAYIASRLSHIQTLILDLPYSTELSEWVASASASGKPLSPPYHATLPTLLGELRQVTYLNIQSTGYGQDQRRDVNSFHPRQVASFMARFPALKTAILTGLFNAPLEAVRTEHEFWDGIKTMWDVCHNLEDLRIHGIGRRGVQSDIMNWTREKQGPTPGIHAYSQYFVPNTST